MEAGNHDAATTIKNTMQIREQMTNVSVRQQHKNQNPENIIQHHEQRQS